MTINNIQVVPDTDGQIYVSVELFITPWLTRLIDVGLPHDQWHQFASMLELATTKHDESVYYQEINFPEGTEYAKQSNIAITSGDGYSTTVSIMLCIGDSAHDVTLINLPDNVWAMFLIYLRERLSDSSLGASDAISFPVMDENNDSD